jgi:hypothetical protein
MIVIVVIIILVLLFMAENRFLRMEWRKKPGYIASPYAGVDGDIEPNRFTFSDCNRFWQFLAPVNSLISDINHIGSGFEDEGIAGVRVGNRFSNNRSSRY